MKVFRRSIIPVVFTTVISAADMGGYAGAFLRVGTTARSMALGGGLTAAVDNGFSAYHNPAAVAFLEKRRISVFHHFLPLDRYLVSASFATSLPPTGGLGIGLLNAGVDDIDGRDQAGHQTGTLSTSEYALYFSFSNRPFESLSVGVNVKLLQNIIPFEGKQTSKGIGVDVGIMIRQFEKFDLGIVIQDLNAAYTWNTGDIFDEKGKSYRDPFPIQVRTGFNYHSGLFSVMGDHTYFSTEDGMAAHRVRMGGEYEVRSNVTVRGGMNNFSPAVGVGLNYSLLKRDDAIVDYAFALGRRGEGVSHILTYVFTF
ncbi:MAG: hypothetical protein V3U24_11195 [Candidatus Neomarinimicrobiota bacterium]